MLKIIALFIGTLLLAGCSQEQEPIAKVQRSGPALSPSIQTNETIFDKYKVPPYQTDEIKVSDVFIEKMDGGLKTYLKMENMMGDSLGLNTMDSSILILTTDKGSYQAFFPKKILKSNEVFITTIEFPKAQGNPLFLGLKGLYRTNNKGIASSGSEPISAVISLQPKLDASKNRES